MKTNPTPTNSPTETVSDKDGINYYCPDCKDELCSKCVEFPWECPEIKTCTECLKELKIVEKLWVKYQRGEIKL